MTLTAWVKLGSDSPLLSGSNVYNLVYKGTVGGNIVQFALEGGAANGLIAEIESGGTTQQVTPATDQSAILSDGNWHYVAFVRDATGNGTLYLDGSSVGSQSGMTGSMTSNQPLWVGRGETGGYFNGTIDHVVLETAALSGTSIAATHNQDSDHNGLPDWWEFEYFGATGQNPNALAARGDGLTLLQCFQQGLDPNDFYNGISPTLTIISGTNQTGAAGALLTAPMVVQVTGSSGQLMTNAPVTFAVTLGTGSLAPDLSGTWAASSSFPVRTGTNGNAQIYFQQPMEAAFTSTVAVMAAKSEVDFSEITLPDNNAPGAPSSVSAVVQGDGSVLVTWKDNSDNETGFTIKQSNDGGQTWTTVGTAGADATSVTVAAGGNVTNGLTQFESVAMGSAGNTSSSGTNNGTAFQPIPTINYAVIDMSGTIPNSTNVSRVALDDNNHAAFMFVDSGSNCKSFTWQNGATSSSPTATLTLSGTTTYEIHGLLPDGTIFGDQWIGQYWDEATSGGFSALGSSITFADVPPPFIAGAIHGGISQYQITGTSSFALAESANYTGYGGEQWFVKHGGAYTVFTATSHPQTIGETQILNVLFNPFLVNDIGWLVAGTTGGTNSQTDPAVWIGSGTNVVSLAPMSSPVAINNIGQVIGVTGTEGYLWTSGSNNWSAAPFVQNGTSQPVSQLISGTYQNEVSYISPFAISGTNANNSVGMLFGAQYKTDSKGDLTTGTFLLTLTNGGTSSVMQQVVVPSNVNASLSILNSQGLIGGMGTITGTNGVVSAQKALLLLPVELVVDANRDGFVELTSGTDVDASGNPVPADTTSQDKPYRFWINDDQDTVSGDVVPVTTPDYNEPNIKSIRDLEDWARLWIDLKGAATMVKGMAHSGGISVGLQFEPIPGDTTDPLPAIKICEAVEPDGGTGYLTDDGNNPGDDDWADQQIGGQYDVPIKDSNGNSTIGSQPFMLPNTFWDDVDNATPKHLIFEGMTEGKGKLTLVFYQNGNKMGEGGALYLDIKNIKKMYERVKAQPENISNPSQQASGPFTGPVNYVSDPNGNPFAKPWDESKQCVVFVHGWNTDYNGYINTSETLLKRLWWQGYKGHVATFRWDTLTSQSAFDPGQFNRSENRAWVYGAALKSWMGNLSASGYTVSLICHSMGNVVAGEALRQGATARNYLLMEAAAPASCYDPNVATEQRLTDSESQYSTPDWQSDPSTHQLTLGYRGYLQNITGSIVNFYNSDDFALETGQSTLAGITVETNWVKNQIDYKPDGVGPGSNRTRSVSSWFYGFTSQYPLAARDWVYNSSFWFNTPNPAYNGDNTMRAATDSWEVKAFVARSRTRAVGAQGATGGPIADSVDLKATYNFTTSRADHSGQFTRNIQDVFDLYQDVNKRIGK